MSLLFSIVTASLNPGVGIKVTADCLARQLCRDFEWIIVDSSTDTESKAIVANSAEKQKGLLLSMLDTSISSAWNIGIRSARGMYILLLNAGDTYSDTFLEACKTRVGNDILLCGQPYVVSKTSEKIYKFKAEPNKLWRGMHLAHNWICVPRSAYLPDNLYKEIPFAMDYEWILRTLSYGIYKIVVLNDSKSGDGMYTLGGISDVNYYKSLSTALGIALAYHRINWLFIPVVYIGYTLKRMSYILRG